MLPRLPLADIAEVLDARKRLVRFTIPVLRLLHEGCRRRVVHPVVHLRPAPEMGAHLISGATPTTPFKVRATAGSAGASEACRPG